jgi:hypothetical protein
MHALELVNDSLLAILETLFPDGVSGSGFESDAPVFLKKKLKQSNNRLRDIFQ